MTKTLLYLAAVITLTASSFSKGKKIKNANELLREMYKTYKGNWHTNFTFTQTTENYRNDSLIKISTWYESIVYPNYFRISFGDVKDGNAMIQVGDSAFNFRKGKLIRKGPKGEDLTFLLGGMYFIPFDSVTIKMKKEGYDLNKFHEATWQGRDAYVIGAASANEKSNQLWIDKSRLVVVRFVKYEAAQKEEAIFGDHKKFGKAWSETSCVFYVNDKPVQKETYNNCKANGGVDMRIFDPYNFKSD